MVFEACVGNYKEALENENLGAHRIELCSNLIEGGVTPSYGTIKKAVSTLKIPVIVMIRPRPGSFEFDKDEIQIMLDDIKKAKELGAYGVAIGALKGDKIDIKSTRMLVEEAKPLRITFHMAFDEVNDQFKAMEQLIKLNIDRILTKGGKESAWEGKEKLRELVCHARGRIIIMPGKGITKDNRESLQKYTKALEVHGTKIVK
ncbi:copper homeostasis protein CutC [Proteinivorax tanatarense]|uniref:PF03932 family protein CutC n=1 Tax=Proteinivorax tanatarense TaxID=1260629 RepID=A0AAU7VKD6_9FIRM